MSQSIVNTLRRKGRPKGAGRKLAVLRNWQPKQWKVEYEAIVLGHCKGLTNIELGKIFGFTDVHIGNIINCVRANEMKEEIRKNLPHKEVEGMYKDILLKATERLQSFINSDTVFEKYPIAAVDRAMKSMEMIDARLRAREGGGKTTNNTLVLASQENVNRLLSAMNKSKLSDQLHDNRETTDINRLTNIAVAG